MLQLSVRLVPRSSLWAFYFTQSRYLVSVLATLALSACGGGGGADGPNQPQQPSTMVTIGGSVAGLAAGSVVVLRNNDSHDLPVASNVPFTFTAPVTSGGVYTVTVGAQPINPSQNCTVLRGVGTAGMSNVTNISVTCTTNNFTISGTVSGLRGSGLVLQNNGGNSLAVTSDGAFTFSSSILSGDPYAVTIGTQPSRPNQVCAVTSGSGTVTSGNVTNVAVVCTTNTYVVGGIVTGLAGTGLVLQNNGGSDLTVLANGSFNFVIPVASGDNYAVTVPVQPINVSQTCSVANSTGTMSNAGIFNVVVTCTTNRFSIGGTVSGLSGSGLALSNGAVTLPISANGTFAFANTVLSGNSFAVSAVAQPSTPYQTCALSNGSGTVGNGNVTTIAIVCTTNTYTVGGTVTGLVGGGLALRNNGADDRVIAANGEFTFGTRVPSGGAYDVSVFTTPTNPTQTCTPGSNTGTVSNGNVTGVTIVCTVSRFAVGVTVSGLAGGSVMLQNNGGDDLTVGSNGTSWFATPIASGASYDMRVITQPANPNQICRISDGVGTVTNAIVTSPTIDCVTQHPRFAFSVDNGNQSISTYAIDATTGQLRRRGFTNTGLRPSQMGRDATGRFLFVLNRGAGTVSAYTHDSVTGDNVEVSGSPYLTGAVPNSVFGGDGLASLSAHPTKGFLYISNGSGVGANNIAGFAINSVTGVLTPMIGSPFAAGLRPSFMTIDALGRFLYVVNNVSNDIYTYSIDQTTGALVELTGSRVATGTAPTGMIVLHPNGRFAFASNSGSGNISVYTVNAVTGALTAVSGSPFLAGVNPGHGPWFHPSGRFLYLRNAGATDTATGSVSAYSINLTTGALTQLPGSPHATGINSSTSSYDPAGRFLYILNRGMSNLTAANSVGSISGFAIDASTGLLTPISGSPMTIQPAPVGIDVDPSGRFAYVPSVQGNLAYSFTVNQSTGVLTPLASGAILVTRDQPWSLDAQSEKLTPAAATFRSKFAYVPNSTDNTLSGYTIDAGTGTIAPITTVASAGNTPRGMVVHPNSKYVYATSETTPLKGIASHTLNPLSGVLSTPTSSLFTADGLSKLRISPNGRGVYALAPSPVAAPSAFIRAYGVNPATGLLSPINTGYNGLNTITNSSDIFVSPTGRFLHFIVDDRWGYGLLDQFTGGFPGENGNQSPTASGKSALVIEPSGRFAYIALATAPIGGVEVWATNPYGGLFVGAVIQTVATGAAPKALAADPTGRFLYVANSGSNDVSSFVINQTNGQLSEVLPRVAAGTNPTSISADYSGKYVYVISRDTNAVLAYAINPVTGALTALSGPVAATGNGANDIALSSDVE